MKVTINYDHDPADLTLVEIAVRKGKPTEADWKPALRDTVDGQRVVWARFDDLPGDAQVWLRDGAETRRVRPR